MREVTKQVIELLDIIREKAASHRAIPIIQMDVDLGTSKAKAFEILLQQVSSDAIFKKSTDLMKANIYIGVTALDGFVGVAFVDITAIGAQEDRSVSTDIAMIDLSKTKSATDAFHKLEAAIMRYNLAERKLDENV